MTTVAPEAVVLEPDFTPPACEALIHDLNDRGPEPAAYAVMFVNPLPCRCPQHDPMVLMCRTCWLDHVGSVHAHCAYCQRTYVFMALVKRVVPL